MIQLTKQEKQTVQAILKKILPTAMVKVFGSRVKGTAKPYSDLDIAIDDKKKVPLLVLSELEEAFADSDLLFKVDIVDWHRISKEFQDVINQQYSEL